MRLTATRSFSRELKRLQYRHAQVSSLPYWTKNENISCSLSLDSYNEPLLCSDSTALHRVSLIKLLCPSPHRRGKLPSSDLPKWLFSCVCSNVLSQIAKRCEVFTAAFRFTVKCFSCVKPLMCFQPANHSKEIPLTTCSTVRALPEANVPYKQVQKHNKCCLFIKLIYICVYKGWKYANQ